ncbi:hypothetical protein DFH11DRAFT_1540791 [Phellopilus nigrolimitatus]|nr:hypothetical protein DFH11DRAFT_1540791 [Phellopilus nigrolimitatus]
MASGSGNGSNAFNNSNSITAASVNSGQGQLSISQYLENQRRIEDAKRRLAAFEAQNTQRMLQDLQKQAVEGRHAELAIQALQSGALRVADLMRMSTGPRAIQYPGIPTEKPTTSSFPSTSAGNAYAGGNRSQQHGAQFPNSHQQPYAIPRNVQHHPGQLSNQTTSGHGQAYHASSQTRNAHRTNASAGRHSIQLPVAYAVPQQFRTMSPFPAMSGIQEQDAQSTLPQEDSIHWTNSTSGASTLRPPSAQVVSNPGATQGSPDLSTQSFAHHNDNSLSASTSRPLSAQMMFDFGAVQASSGLPTYSAAQLTNSSSLAGALDSHPNSEIHNNNYTSYLPTMDVSQSATQRAPGSFSGDYGTSVDKRTPTSVETASANINRPAQNVSANTQRPSVQGASITSRDHTMQEISASVRNFSASTATAQGTSSNDLRTSLQSADLQKPMQNIFAEFQQTQQTQPPPAGRNGSQSAAVASRGALHAYVNFERNSSNNQGSSSVQNPQNMSYVPATLSSNTTVPPVPVMSTFPTPTSTTVQPQSQFAAQSGIASSSGSTPLSATSGNIYRASAAQMPFQVNVGPQSRQSGFPRSDINYGINATGMQNVNATAYSTMYGPHAHYRNISMGQAPNLAANPGVSSAPITPASADKKRLALDILRALGPPSAKRKATTPPSSASSSDEPEPAAKRQAIERPLTPQQEQAVIELDSSEEVENEVSLIDAVAGSEAMADIAMAQSPVPEAADGMLEQLPVGVPDMDTALRPFEESTSPLFLPSPGPSSEVPSIADSRHTSHFAPTSSSTSGLKSVPGPTPGLSVSVEVTPLSPTLRQRFRRRLPVVEVVIPGSNAKSLGSASATAEDARATADIAASRLRKRPCLWNACSSVSNSANNLREHVKDHVDLQTQENIHPCQWSDCVRRFKTADVLFQHLQNHVRRTIFCAYQGCDEKFKLPTELQTHVETKHGKDSKLRPLTIPFQHVGFKRMPPLQTMFSYHDVHLPVQMYRTTKERRAKFGPWVVKNMFGAVNLGMPKHDARYPLRGGRRREDVKQDGGERKQAGDWHDKFDFMEPWSATYPSSCEDLESFKVTESLHNGLLLAPDIDGPQGPLEEQYFTSLTRRLKEGDIQQCMIKAEADWEEEPEHEEVKEEEPEVGLSAVASSPNVHQESLQRDDDAPGISLGTENSVSNNNNVVEGMITGES